MILSQFPDTVRFHIAQRTPVCHSVYTIAGWVTPTTLLLPASFLSTARAPIMQATQDSDCPEQPLDQVERVLGSLQHRVDHDRFPVSGCPQAPCTNCGFVAVICLDIGTSAA